jgi:L,D-transpeptidase catalytic domain/LysM domain
MLRLVLGLSVAGLAAWYVMRSSEGEMAGAEPGQRTELSTMLEQDKAATPAAQPAPVTETHVAQTGSIDAQVETALDSLIVSIRSGDSKSKEKGQSLLERKELSQAQRERLFAALQASAGSQPTAEAAAASPFEARLLSSEDFAEVLTGLGSNNAFLQSADGRALGRRATALIQKMKDEQAVDAGTKLLDLCMRGSIERAHADAIAFVDEAYKLHRARADRFLCDPDNLSRARSHQVAAGDSLAKLAAKWRKEGIAIDETGLAILNRIKNPNSLRVGQRIRCPVDPIHAVVEKRSYLMAVYVGERMLRLYWVGHGAGDKTPVTEFTVQDKLKDPDWYAPDGQVHPAGSPENILGHYFVKFANPDPGIKGYGAHGTPRPETVGTMSSMGCIRMYDDDIKELYLLLPRKAKVLVRESI